MLELTLMLALGSTAVAPEPSAPASGTSLPARGASKAQVRVREGERTLTLKATNLTPGAYRVLLATTCPREQRPSDVRTGRVDPRRRSGTEKQDLMVRTLELPQLIVSDRTPVKHSVALPAAAADSNTAWTHLMVREDDVRPSLSDRFGLVACGRRAK